jgi:hypothetical protein
MVRVVSYLVLEMAVLLHGSLFGSDEFADGNGEKMIDKKLDSARVRLILQHEHGELWAHL